MNILASRVLPLGALVLGAAIATPASATVSFGSMAPGYSQEIYTGDISGLGWGPGMAWKPNGQLLLRGNNHIYEYSLTADTVYGPNTVHSYVDHVVTGDNFGYDMTVGLDGTLYGIGGTGLVTIDTTTWTASLIAGTVGGFYGLATLPDGRLAYSDTFNLYIYDPVLNTNAFVYSAGAFIDGLATTSTGEVFLSVLGASRVDVWKDGFGLLNSVGVSHLPDGMAFGGGAAYANNTDGTVTRLDFALPGYMGAVTETIIASGGSYGDLAAAGPDCAFYVSQWNRGGPEGNHVTRITRDDVACGFDPDPGTDVPEPGTSLLLGLGALGLGSLRRRAHPFV